MSEKPLSCAAYDEDLSALLDGELSEAREAEVRAHLGSCSGCTAHLDALRGVDRLLAAAPAPPVPAGLRDRLEARLSAPAPRPLAAQPRRSPPRPGTRWLAPVGLAAAAAALVLYFGVRTLGTPGNGAGGAPPLPQIEVSPAPPPRVALEIDLEEVSDEELALALELESIEDLELIANLDLLVRLLAAEEAG